MRNAAVASLALMLAGCGGGGGGTTTVADYSQIRSMGAMYESFLNAHGGQPPKNEAEFRAFLTEKEGVLGEVGMSIDDMFVSPHGGEMVWLYDQKLPKGVSGMTYLGYEKEAVDGKRLVIAVRGMYEDLDETAFKGAFPAVN